MMFRRLLWHLLRGNRVRMIVALLALTSGGAVISALLNLNVDVSRQLSREFRTLGANVVISAPSATTSAGNTSALMDVSALQTVQRALAPDSAASPYLYVVARAASAGGRNVVVSGTWLDRITQLSPSWKISGSSSLSREDMAHCLVGRNAAQTLNLSLGSKVELASQNSTEDLTVSAIVDAGAPEDNQIFVNLPVAQKLAATGAKTQFIELSVAGSPDEIRGVQSRLQSVLPNLTVRPIPQVAEAEGKLLGRIRFLMVSTGLLILVLTALCILAVMAAMAMERRKDVGLMKALGGSMQKVLRIFLAEVGILGFAGGILGYVLGVFLSIWMGHRVFGVSISPRWEVFPLTVALMLIVSLAGALPLRLLGNIRPAVILRGE
jgi:putative ABC transport system permease protein